MHALQPEVAAVMVWSRACRLRCPTSGRKILCEPEGSSIGTLVVYALKLLFPVLVIGLLALFGLRPAFASLLTRTQYQRAAFLMIVTTAVAFLAHSQLIYVIVLGGIALFAQAYLGGGTRGKVAAYMLLVLVLPPLAYGIGGLGDINYVLDISGSRMLALVLLPGAALRLLADRKSERPRWVAAVDLALISYAALKIALMAPHASMTTSLRSVVEFALDVWLPYYVVSRGIRSEVDLRFVLSHLAMGFALAASIGCAEFFVHRNLYSELQWVYGFKWQLTMNLMRGDHLRVQAMTPQPIVLAFEMIFALGLWTYLLGSEWRRKSVLLVYGLMAACLFFTFSRGPLLGGLIFGLCLLGLHKLPTRAFVALFLLLLAAAIVAKAVGADAAIMTALSGVFGSTSADISSIAYRNELLDTALALLRQSPWLGVPDYGARMQDLKQGEGIIDLVNSYVAIALDAGLIGLVIYLLPYGFALNRHFRLLAAGGAQAAEAGKARFTRVFAALTIALLLTIFTTSTISTMPFLLVMLLALPIARLSMKAAVDGGERPAPTRIYTRDGFYVTDR
jgi:O-antigen ligase